MSNALQQAATLRNAFDMVEEAYEFMLAYAAQGRRSEVGEGGGESQIRNYLRRFDQACDTLSGATEGLGGASGARFASRFAEDIAVVRSIIAILLDSRSISSDMIDNTNGLIAMRAFLTDIFFIDQAVLPPR
jgi:hypothetical protein